MHKRNPLSTILALLYALFAILPAIWVFISSFKTNPEIFSSPWSLPGAPEAKNYANAWVAEGIGQGFFISTIVCLLTLLLLLPIGSMAAYALGRFPFKGRGMLATIFLIGMMFPNFLTIMPLYRMMLGFGLHNTIHGIVIVYVAYSLSFTIFVLTGFFQAIPNELAEAAELDGCGEFGTFTKVMVPIARPGIIVVGIFNAIGLWNEYPLAVVLLSKPELRSLPLKVADMAMAQQYQADYGRLFAGLTLSMVPVLIVYFFLREPIHRAMLAGAIKG